MSWFRKINWNVFAVIWKAMLAADKSVRLWALILALPFITLIVVWVIYLVASHWHGGHEGEQIHDLFIIAESLIGLLAIGFVFLTATNLSASGPGGFKFGVGSTPDPQDLPPNTTITATQTVEKKDVK
jgi:hypothetical protein